MWRDLLRMPVPARKLVTTGPYVQLNAVVLWMVLLGFNYLKSHNKTISILTIVSLLKHNATAITVCRNNKNMIWQTSQHHINDQQFRVVAL